jgi:hypothetical protein
MAISHFEQTARSAVAAFNFNGTAGLWRKSCIEQAGRQHDTLTEDPIPVTARN